MVDGSGALWVSRDNGKTAATIGCKLAQGLPNLDISQITAILPKPGVLPQAESSPLAQAVFLAIRGPYDAKNPEVMSPHLAGLSDMAVSANRSLPSADTLKKYLLNLDRAFNPCLFPNGQVGAFKCIGSIENGAHYAFLDQYNTDEKLAELFAAKHIALNLDEPQGSSSDTGASSLFPAQPNAATRTAVYNSYLRHEYGIGNRESVLINKRKIDTPAGLTPKNVAVFFINHEEQVKSKNEPGLQRDVETLRPAFQNDSSSYGTGVRIVPPPEDVEAPKAHTI